MASTRAGLKIEGGLYEAIARGNKDTFFFDQDPEKAINPFENRYDRIPPNLQELRRIPPLNGAEFGRSCEFEFETAGDIFLRPTVVIDLPSWYPPSATALNPSLLFTEQGTGNTYGYTNGVGYFLFKKIQIFQDKLLLQELTGDSLFALRASRGSLNSAYMENALAGFHDGTAASIAANATPSRIRLELPFLGGHNGFPSIAMRKQTFKLRLELRPLEQLIEYSDPAATVAPKPWGTTFVHMSYVGQTLGLTSISSSVRFGANKEPYFIYITTGLTTIPIGVPAQIINSTDATNSYYAKVMSYAPVSGLLELSPVATNIQGIFDGTPTLYNVIAQVESFTALQRTQMASPTLQLETRHTYVDGETQLALRSTTLEIPYSRPYENTYVISPAEYAPIVKGVAAYVTRRVDAQHPASRLLWYSRSQNDLRANRRWKFMNSMGDNEYYAAQSLIIASRDRETLFTPYVWNLLTHHAKEDRDPGYGIGEMSWDLGDIRGRRAPWDRQPEGTINFTTADRPTLYTSLSLAPNDTILGTPSTEMTAVVDTWGLYSIEQDRGVLKYGN
jgi:hypothetical protein